MKRHLSREEMMKVLTDNCVGTKEDREKILDVIDVFPFSYLRNLSTAIKIIAKGK